MNDHKHGHHPHGEQDRDDVHRDHRPYWKRAHRDWRLWGAVLVMLVAMTIYVMSNDLAWWPRGPAQQPQSGAPSK
jgi:hypothetical protein